MNKLQGIYKIVNCVNGKIYVGQSIDIEKRFREHRYNIDRKIHNLLYRAIRKYGIDNFEFIIIEKVEEISKLDERETYWIQHYKSYDRQFGYNLTQEGATTKGYKHRDETKQKISEIHKGKKLSEEHKKAISEFMSSRKHTEEALRKMSESQKGRKLTKEHKLKLCEGQKEYWSDSANRQEASERASKLYEEHPEIKQKISESVKKLYDDPEYKENHKLTDDGRKKLSNYAKERWDDPEFRNKSTKWIESFRKKFDLEEIKDLYLVKNLNMYEIAEILSCCRNTLSRFIKENNLKKPRNAYKNVGKNLKEYWSNPENKKLHSEKMKQACLRKKLLKEQENKILSLDNISNINSTNNSSIVNL